MRMKVVASVVLALALAGCGVNTPLNPRRVTSGQGDKVSPDFSPDGQWIVYERKLSDNETQLFVIGLDGTGERQLTCVPSMNGQPAWSHDGTRVAFRSNRLGRGQSNLFVVAADVGEKPGLPQAVPLDQARFFSGKPTWSPDDSRIAFESDRSGNFDIWVMDADGDNATAITKGPMDKRTPAWSPDGKLIAFSAGRAGERNLWLTKPDGSMDGQVTSGEAVALRPRWTPDRKLVFMRSETKTFSEIYEVGLTGNGLHSIFVVSSEVCDPVVSPDGRWLAFSANPEGRYEIFLLRLRD